MAPGSQVTFIVPCLNEEACLRDFLKESVSVFATDRTRTWSIIVVDNGSTDRSVEIAKAEGATVEIATACGYGSAVDAGIRAALTKYVVFADADGTYNPRDAIRLVDTAEADSADLVTGSRLRGEIEPGAMPCLHRYLGTPALSFLIRLVTGLRITDCNCGIRCVKRSSYLEWGLTSKGMEFASEMFMRAAHHRARVTEIPVSLRRAQFARNSKLRPIRDGLRHTKTIITRVYRPWFLSWAVILLTLAIVGGFNFLTGLVPDLTHGYSPDLSHRYQTEALFRGHLALSKNPGEVRLDWAWSHGHWYQVWGLGVSLIRMPFEVAARALGYEAAPDRIIFLAVMFISLGMLGVQIAKGLRPQTRRASWQELLCILCVAIGAVLLAALYPGFQNLFVSRFRVYEETVAYGCVISLLIFSLLLASRRVRSPGRICFIAFIFGLGVLIRPTVLFAGLAALVALLLELNQAGSTKRLGLAVLILFSAGPIAQASFNQIRFGSPVEFGHALNVSSIPLNNYALRFDAPISTVSPAVAMGEIVSSLFFLDRLNGYNFYQQGLSSLEAPVSRFREMRFVPYTSVWAFISAFSLLIAGGILVSKRGRKTLSSLFALWSMLSLSGQFVLYLYSPSLASRYLIDFFPGLVVLWLTPVILVAERLISAHRARQCAAFGLIIVACVALCCAQNFPAEEHYSLTPAIQYDAVVRSVKRSERMLDFTSASKIVGASISCPSVPLEPSGQMVSGLGQRCEASPLVMAMVQSARCYEARFEGEESSLLNSLNAMRLKEQRISFQLISSEVRGTSGLIKFCRPSDADAHETAPLIVSIATIPLSAWREKQVSKTGLIFRKLAAVAD